MLRVKSVYTPIDRKKDGLRILVTRFRGRGLPATRYDVWMANLGPSEKLLREGQSEDITWGEFATLYRQELFEDARLDRGNHTIKNHGQKFTLRLIKELARKQNVTLMCHCDEDQQQCHRHVLKKFILSGKI
jgi:uncharacterized protein YeaO (DUF488 family)